MKTVVIGSGSWGTALAQVLCDNNADVMIYGKAESEVEDINKNNQNSAYFGDLKINPGLKATTDFSQVVDSDIYLLAVPSFAIESVCAQINESATKPFLVITTAKGFHPKSFERMSVVIKDSFKDNPKFKEVISLIGPSHAEEVIQRMYTAINAVCENEEYAKEIQHLFSNQYLRVYTNTDVVGAEYGVALKNAIAIASGVISGLGCGDNTKAALLTRGLAEITRFGVACGGKMETYLGLCGLGDLIVTCTSVHSRNYQAGYAIGKADSATEFLATNTKTVEGINTIRAVYHMAKEMNIDMPIINIAYKVLFEGMKPSESLELLMNRKLVAESR
ncbi:MAG: NAD(P)-dependent glycerol-3-phosphate dehydrogenase [Erysipelotrichaceae bacterium]|nr:NAD(P)-dependent glycerol-3-phosphate dehydrogenase [Erysipelotrichaceae bacterium]